MDGPEAAPFLMLGTDHRVLLEPYSAVYIDIAKVASSSIKAALASLLGLTGAEGNPHDVGFPRPEIYTPNGERLHPGLYSFAFVRNPWDRLVSCYRDKIGGEVAEFTGFSESGVAHCLAGYDAFEAGMTFLEFVHAVASIPDDEADEHFRSQADFVTNSFGAIAVDYIGRYETLVDDFAAVGREIGLPRNLELPRLQAAARKDYSHFYNAESRRLVEARFAKDIDLFQYRF